MPRCLPALAALLASFVPASGFAQTEAAGCRATPGVSGCFTVSARASLLSAGVVPAAVLGVNVAFDLTDRVALEGEALYFTKARWASAMAATAAVRVAVGPFIWSDGFVPFVIGGAGLHRANVDLFDPRLLGAIPPTVPAGAAFCPGRGATGPDPAAPAGPGNAACEAGGTGPRWGVGDLPDYFARRLGTLVVPADRRWPRRAFVDPAMTAGGGVHVHVGTRLVLQPEARVWVTLSEGDTRIAGVFGVLAGYSF